MPLSVCVSCQHFGHCVFAASFAIKQASESAGSTLEATHVVVNSEVVAPSCNNGETKLYTFHGGKNPVGTENTTSTTIETTREPSEIIVKTGSASSGAKPSIQKKGEH